MDVSKCVAKLPKPFATDDPGKDAHLVACWRAAQKVISAMQSDWDLALTTWHTLEMKMAEKKKTITVLFGMKPQ